MRTCTLAHSYIRRNRNDTKLRKSDIRGYYIDRSEESRRVYSVRGSSTWKTIDVMKSWRYHSSLYSPRFTPKKRKLFPLSKGNGIECLENYHRSSVSNFDAGQPPSFLPPKLFHSIGENSFICRLSLSLSSLNSRSSSFLVRGNSMFRLKQRRIEKWGWTGSFSKLFRVLRDGRNAMGISIKIDEDIVVLSFETELFAFLRIA